MSEVSMLRAVATTDGWVSRTRPAWLWLGQLGVVALGIHLACDRMDDHLLVALTALPVDWPDPELPLEVSTWVALATELAAVAFAALCLVRARADRVDHPRRWVKRLSVHAVVSPLFWAPTALAGAWVMGMATEDLLAPWLGSAAVLFGWIAAGLIAWRLAATGFVAVLLNTPEPRRRIEGWWAAPLALGVGWLAIRHGLPIWGWLS
jgi:hypothetical protein